MRSTSLTSIVTSLCLPLALLTGCPGDDTGDDGATPTTTDPSVDTSTTTDGPPTDTDTDPTAPPPDTDTDPTSPPPDTDTDPTAPPTDTDTDTDGPVPGCECIPDDDIEDSASAPSSPTCGENPCGNVWLTCDGDCGDTPAELDSPAALECALIALRDRTPGLVTWRWRSNAGQFEDEGYVLVNEDGTAVRRNWGWTDLYYETTAGELGELPPPEHFDACLAEPDDNLRFECLRGQLESTIAVCDEGWNASKR